MNILGCEDFVDIFKRSSQIGLDLGSFLCILGYLLKVKVQNLGYFWFAKILRRKKNVPHPPWLINICFRIYRPSMETFEVNLVLEY